MFKLKPQGIIRQVCNRIAVTIFVDGILFYLNDTLGISQFCPNMIVAFITIGAVSYGFSLLGRVLQFLSYVEHQRYQQIQQLPTDKNV
jgi:hypothetical protein